MQPGIRIGKGDHRPWLEKWKFVLHHLDRLRRYYESDVPDTGNLDVEAWATGFFVECDHLVDWLSQDISALGGVTGKRRHRGAGRGFGLEQHSQPASVRILGATRRPQLARDMGHVSKRRTPTRGAWLLT